MSVIHCFLVKQLDSVYPELRYNDFFAEIIVNSKKEAEELLKLVKQI